MRVAFFSAHDFERQHFIESNAEHGQELVFFKEALNAHTAPLASGFPAVCAFVTDTLDAATLRKLAWRGTRLIAMRAAGFNNVDRDAARELGLTVMRVPAYAPAAIAEHAVALMMTLNRRIHHAYNRARDGNFTLDNLIGFNMAGKTVGIVGTGNIGVALARIMNGFGCELLGYDVQPNPACIELGLRYTALPELLQQSDIVSLHCPLTPETTHLIDEETLQLMKPGSMLINTARGAIVDACAVMEALKKQDRLAYFAMDVYEGEGPIFFLDHSATIIEDDVFQRLTTFPNVIITGHQAFLTREALSEIAHITLGNIGAFEAGEPKPANTVVTGKAKPARPEKAAA